MEQIMMKEITDETAEVREKKSAEQADQQEKRKRKRADQQGGNKRKRKDEGMSEEAKQENIRRKKEITSKDVSFSKRRRGLFAKTTEFCKRFDHTQIAIVILSRAQRPYAFGHPSVDAVLDHYLQQGSSPSSSSSASTSASVTGHELQQQMHRFEELKAKLKSRQDNEELCRNTSTISSVTLDAVKKQIEEEIRACQTLQELESLRQKYLVLLDNINSINSSNNSLLLEHHQAADHMAQYSNLATKPIISPDEDHGTINFNFNGAGGSDKTVNYSNLANLSFSEDDHDHDHVISTDVENPSPAANFNGATSYIRQKNPDDRDHCGSDINGGNGTAWDPDSIVDYLFDNDVEGACWDTEGAGCPSGAASDASFDPGSGFVQQNTHGVYSRTYSELEHLIYNPN